MTFYVDTSVVVAAISNEKRTSDAQAWLREHAEQGLWISDWITTELSAALSAKAWRGETSPAIHAASRQAFDRLVASVFQTEQVSTAVFREASLLAARHLTGVRAGDLLHLAICFLRGHRLCTLDIEQAKIGQTVGVEALLL